MNKAISSLLTFTLLVLTGCITQPQPEQGWLQITPVEGEVEGLITEAD